MSDTANSLEGIKLIADWAKWLITIETVALAAIGSAVGQQDKVPLTREAKILGTGAMICFVLSIAAAAFLLLSLPEIAQELREDANINIWLTSDSVIGNVFRVNTQTLAITESFFFGTGVLAFAGMVLARMWSKLH